MKWRAADGRDVDTFDVTDVIKLSSRATHEFWELPVLYEDDDLLALNKPAGLLTVPDRFAPERPSLIQLLHGDIERGAAWATGRQLSYLLNSHRLDGETSGVFLLAKRKAVLVALANLFNAEKPLKTFVALVQGAPAHTRFEIDAKLAPHPMRHGVMRVNSRGGKRSITRFEVREPLAGYTLLQCQPLTDRTHQIRIHLQVARLPLTGDSSYGGRPLLLSKLKPGYRLKPGRIEKPLLSRPALHAEQLAFPHPVTGVDIKITALWPNDLNVALKYLRRFCPAP